MIRLILLLLLVASCSHKTFYASSIEDRGTTVLTLKESMAKLQGINSRDSYDSILSDYKYIIVNDKGESKKYSVIKFREILFPPRSRYPHNIKYPPLEMEKKRY